MSINYAFLLPHPPLIIPEIGKGNEKLISETINSYEKVSKIISEQSPQVIIILTPHSTTYSDYFHISSGEKATGNFLNFGFSNIEISTTYDKELAEKITQMCEERAIPAGFLGEKEKNLDHGTMIPLWFIQKLYKNFNIVRISISGLSLKEHYILGKCINDAVNRLGRNAVLIASGDLSHKLKADGPYGFSKEGPEFDRKILEYLRNSDFLSILKIDENISEKAAECGLRPISVMAGVFDKTIVSGNILSYEGPFGVGYGVGVFKAENNNDRDIINEYENYLYEKINNVRNNESDIVKLARLTLEYAVKSTQLYEPDWSLPDELLNKKAGTFVTIYKQGRLRGCIGTIAPTQSCLAKEVMQNAISAGLSDSRFEPVEERELQELIYSVDVLSEPESINSIEELDVYKYGVIVSCDKRRGLLLPNLEGIDTVDKQISIALEKGGISKEEPYELFRFQVVRHS